MHPAIAEYAVRAYTRSGDIVLDPDCGAGTTVVEALRAGRHAIGLTTAPRWWRLARTNVTAAKAAGAAPDGMVLVLNRRDSTITAALRAGLAGRVDLLLTTLHPAGNPDDAVGALRAVLTDCRPLLRPGSHVVVIVPPTRHPTRHHLLDLPGRVLTVGMTAALAPVARCLALTGDHRPGRVIAERDLEQRRASRQAERATGVSISVPAYVTAVVLRADPDAADGVLALPIPPLPRPHRDTAAPRSIVGVAA